MTRQPKYKKIYKEWKEATPQEVWEGVRDNFTLEKYLSGGLRGEGYV